VCGNKFENNRKLLNVFNGCCQPKVNAQFCLLKGEKTIKYTQKVIRK
jgi:hypothetical protein